MLKRGKRPSWPRLLLSGLFGLAFLPSTAAAAVQGIGLSPTSQEITAAPGDTFNGQITVINDGDRDVNYKVYAADYHVNGEDYVGDFASTTAQAQTSPVTWFTLPKGTFTAKSRQQTNFAYSLKVPAGAAVGGHYGAIFIETIPPPASAGALIARVDRIGSLMYITVTGDLKKSGSLIGLQVPVLQSVSPVTGSLRLKNDGNVHYTAEGSTQLESLFGNAGAPQPFKGTVLPGTTRKFDIKLAASTPIGLYKVTSTVKYLDRTEIVSQWMLLMPRITFIILSGTLLLLVILGIMALSRRLKRRPKA